MVKQLLCIFETGLWSRVDFTLQTNSIESVGGGNGVDGSRYILNQMVPSMDFNNPWNEYQSFNLPVDVIFSKTCETFYWNTWFLTGEHTYPCLVFATVYLFTFPEEAIGW